MRASRKEHKLRQLCEQASAAVSLALGACGDPLLCDLIVESVEPAPNASRLRVIVTAADGADAPEVLQALTRARGYLRRQVAADIHRTRAPELVFEMAG